MAGANIFTGLITRVITFFQNRCVVETIELMKLCVNRKERKKKIPEKQGIKMALVIGKIKKFLAIWFENPWSNTVFTYQLFTLKATGGPSPKNMNLNRKLVDLKTAHHIPLGYASVKPLAGQVPDGLLYKGNFIPHKLLKDLYDKVKRAKNEIGVAGKSLILTLS